MIISQRMVVFEGRLSSHSHSPSQLFTHTGHMPLCSPEAQCLFCCCPVASAFLLLHSWVEFAVGEEKQDNACHSLPDCLSLLFPRRHQEFLVCIRVSCRPQLNRMSSVRCYFSKTWLQSSLLPCSHIFSTRHHHTLLATWCWQPSSSGFLKWQTNEVWPQV